MRCVKIISLLFILTVCNITHAQTPATQPWTMQISVTSLENNEPIAGAAVTITVFIGEKDVDRKLTTDARGNATFQPTPEMALGWVDVNVRKQGMVSVRHYYYKSEAKTPLPPEHWIFKMEKATSISGRVIDDSGMPVSGAHVYCAGGENLSRSGSIRHAEP